MALPLQLFIKDLLTENSALMGVSCPRVALVVDNPVSTTYEIAPPEYDDSSCRTPDYFSERKQLNSTDNAPCMIPRAPPSAGSQKRAKGKARWEGFTGASCGASSGGQAPVAPPVRTMSPAHSLTKKTLESASDFKESSLKYKSYITNSRRKYPNLPLADRRQVSDAVSHALQIVSTP
jgi:hypothetical protein